MYSTAVLGQKTSATSTPRTSSSHRRDGAKRRIGADITEKARSGACLARGHCGSGHGHAARAAALSAQRRQLIVLLTMLDRELSTPALVTARMAKYQVPWPRLSIM